MNDGIEQTGDPGFIVPPPGLVPDAPAAAPATTKRPRSRPVERSLPTFTPATAAVPAPGVVLPGAAPVAPPAPAAPPPQPAASPSQGWRLMGEGPVEVIVTRRALLGRAPDRSASPVPDAEPIVVNDPARTVSKTHAVAEPGDGVLLVTDLGSTNGVRIERAGAAPTEVARGATAAVAHGEVLVLGEFRLIATAF
ncbi:FHA domain-containing protein [Agromyces silvae]|uniref:FHA domain-containing protein n=1 Tax=Agromyces silvae TaxID=3388266 RepID=UPI00280AF27E|nr:FHA domain-containing protein [Agromyces protaetiae]